MKAPPVAASEALGGCSFLEAESCKAIYADLRPRGILACETIHNKLSAWENQARPVAGNSPSLPALCPDPLFACDRPFSRRMSPDKGTSDVSLACRQTPLIPGQSIANRLEFISVRVWAT